ncbi:competence type IV pilus minor pilin ComGG [Enterococcus asini]|uniref:competence type IV pilus minor pilin ComGG n=1 Tax=Enterococcus TaxID=1350 RepID=UPI0028915250|nr:competence type IV pilus minor pilin ComGG [Enterococcus asini]MDT2757227.1 competence type IV pilus minor pilin ComGG [Enterococcus asini]
MAKFSLAPPKAGVLLSALGLLLIVGMVFYQALENRQMTANLAARTQRAYEVKLMREMFWYNYLQLPLEQRPTSGEVLFNQGRVEFFVEEEVFNLRIWSNERSYRYSYPDFLKKQEEENL